MAKKLTLEEFISKAKAEHGDKYDYSLVDYQGSHTKVKIICPDHGIFEQLAYTHIQGGGCAKCKTKIKLTLKEFISKAKIKHGNRYDYSLVDYENNKTKIKIICSDHGVFEQTAGEHLDGCGCPVCAKEKANHLTLESFIFKAKVKHGNRYDYSEVIYKNTNTPVEIICDKHGSFKQKPLRHINGSGCIKCEAESRSLGTNGFIERSKLIHGDKYDYSKVVYVNQNTKVEIICDEHGVFEQVAGYHMNSGAGCPKCKSSKGENKIEKILFNKNIKYIKQKTFGSCVNPISNRKLFFDFYLPEYNLLIEYDGEQHFKPLTYGGKIEESKAKTLYKENLTRDQIKNQWAFDNNIKLLRIPYTEIKNIEEILDQHILKSPI